MNLNAICVIKVLCFVELVKKVIMETLKDSMDVPSKPGCKEDQEILEENLVMGSERFCLW